jgi:hypothetical protein
MPYDRPGTGSPFFPLREGAECNTFCFARDGHTLLGYLEVALLHGPGKVDPLVKRKTSEFPGAIPQPIDVNVELVFIDSRRRINKWHKIVFGITFKDGRLCTHGNPPLAKCFGLIENYLDTITGMRISFARYNLRIDIWFLCTEALDALALHENTLSLLTFTNEVKAAS